jgi:glycosyltransferase involved in cell wall biosynthesis
MSGLRLAVMNWRDLWHPAAGGAERYAWEVAMRLAASGVQVTYVTSRARGQQRRSRVDGVDFVRIGGRFTVYPMVFLWMAIGRLLRRRSFDAVIDCQNGIPFFTPWALPRSVPIFCLIHHVHDVQFGLYFPRWMAWLGRVLEGPVSRWAYRRHAVVCVSPSTLSAVRERLGWTVPAHIVPNGTTVSCPANPVPDPAGDPELVCVTRLVAHKRVGRLLDLAEELVDLHSGLRLNVIGDGPERPALDADVARRGLGDVVVLHGFVQEEDKAALVARATLHLSTSQCEGWGLSVIEAAALGVPTVAYNVDGLRDAICDGTTGWLATDDPGCPGELADVTARALKELADPGRRRAIANACREWAGLFDWSRTAERWFQLITAAVAAGSSASCAGASFPGGVPALLEQPMRDRDAPG